MTENFAYSHFNRKDNVKVGTVGQPWPLVKQRIAADGEIQIALHTLAFGDIAKHPRGRGLATPRTAAHGDLCGERMTISRLALEAASFVRGAGGDPRVELAPRVAQTLVPAVVHGADHARGE